MGFHFVAYPEEATGVSGNRVHMDRHTGVHDEHGCSEYRHRQWNVRAVWRLRQLHRREGNHVVDLVRRASVSVDIDGVLLILTTTTTTTTT